MGADIIGPRRTRTRLLMVLRALLAAAKAGPVQRRQYASHLARRLYFSLPLSYEHKMAVRSLAARLAPRFWAYLTGKPTPVIPQVERPADVSWPVQFEWMPGPEVSIVIPVFGQLQYTKKCLAALAAHETRFSFEVVVVDDRSPDESLTQLRRCSGVVVVSNEINEGFIASCNRGAAQARGRFLVFLNNDTQVTAAWLDELIGTFRSIEDAGLVGSMLIYPDGRLQEAGGLIWQDGSGWNYGRLDDPRKPEYNYLRETDYCSGASLAIPAALFHELGGFDPHYAPAYGEDSDLAFRVRRAGRKVYFQPLSRVIHYEGVTSGTDTTRGVKAHQVANAVKLFERWQVELREHQPAGMNLHLAVDRGTIGRILVLDHCTPTPDQDAGSITAFNIMQLLRGLGYKVTFIPEDNFTVLPRYTSDLQRIGVEVLYLPYVSSVKQHLERHGAHYDAVLVFRVGAATRHLGTIHQLCPKAKVIFHTSDLHFLREQRRSMLAGGAVSDRAKEIKELELTTMGRVDRVIVHSDVEKEMLHKEGIDHVSVFAWAIEVPGSSSAFGERAHVAFIGGYQHPPNVDAVLYFANEILPLVRAELPDLKFFVVGSLPPPEVRALEADEIVVTGYVPNLGSLLDTIRLAVVPLRYGAGIKGKIATALSYGLPCVSTTIGVEGMGLVPEAEIIVADKPEDFARAIVRVYNDERCWTALSRNGIAFADRKYSLQGGSATLADILQSAGLPVARPVRLAAPVAEVPEGRTRLVGPTCR
jgi:GT2 family glycosyltransferase/glycosyltransferase involved in cell wall biosynthesis